MTKTPCISTNCSSYPLFGLVTAEEHKARIEKLIVNVHWLIFLFIVMGWWKSPCGTNSVFYCVYHLPSSVIFQLPLVLASSKCSFSCRNTHSSLSVKSKVFKESSLSALVSLAQPIQTRLGLSGFTSNFLQRNYLLLLPSTVEGNGILVHN